MVVFDLDTDEELLFMTGGTLPVWEASGEAVFLAAPSRSSGGAGLTDGPGVFRKRLALDAPLERGTAGNHAPTDASLDSRWLLYRDHGELPVRLMAMSLADDEVLEIASGDDLELLDFSASISASGRWVTFYRGGNPPQLFVQDLRGNQVRQIPGGGWGASFASDERSLFFRRGTDVWGLGIGAGPELELSPARLVFEDENPGRPSWGFNRVQSRDGRNFIVLEGVGGPEIGILENAFAEIERVAPHQ